MKSDMKRQQMPTYNPIRRRKDGDRLRLSFFCCVFS